MRTSLLGLLTAGLVVLFVSPEALAAPTHGGMFKQDKVKDAKFSHGLVLKARKHADADFNDKTTRYGVECYKDENNGLVVYICETGSIAVVPGGFKEVEGTTPKEAKFSHGLVLKSRKHDEADFTKDTKKIGVECYTDLNTTYTVYITEDGMISVVKGGAPGGGAVKDAKFSHGLILKARKHAEADFNKGTTKFGVECYRDENNGLSLYVCETGSIAASPKTVKDSPSPVKDAKFVYGLVLKARKENEAEFNDKTTKYGVESYNDDNNGNGIHITEIGTIAVTDNLFTKPDKVNDADFKHGLILKSRKFNEENFGPTTKKTGMECYEDGNSKFKIYITETGNIGVIK